MELTTSAAPPASQPAAVRRITAADLDWALRAGWDDFRAKRGDLLLVPMIYPIAGFIAAALAFNAELFPLIFPLVAGLSILGPAVAAGFYELARRRESNADDSWWHFLDPLKRHSRMPIIVLTMMLAGLFLAWLAAAWAIYGATLGRIGPATPDVFLHNLFTTSEGWTMIVVGNLVGAVFALVTLALSVVSFPMVVDKDVDALAAVQTSIAAVTESPVVMVCWGVTVGLILVAGALPLFIGLAVALPVLGYATWHLYTRVVAR
jgi:uncharacterized membrane protein